MDERRGRSGELEDGFKINTEIAADTESTEYGNMRRVGAIAHAENDVSDGMEDAFAR